jgi:plasmid stabilization system protein ParE
MDKIRIAALALLNVDEAYSRLVEHASAELAEAWSRELFKQIGSLSLMPARCPVAAESGESAEPIRELIFEIRRHKPRYRALFVIRDDALVILHVHQVSRKMLDA